MKIMYLTKIKKLFFSARDIADAFGITYNSAKVTCSRYADKGFIIRIKRNFYISREKWANMSRDEKFSIANILQVPSYISLTTALKYYETTTQMQRAFTESVSVKKTNRFDISGEVFNFSKIKRKYFDNFIKKDNIFIATPEKAFIDAIYLMAFNMYKLDLSAIDFSKIDNKKVEDILKRYPARVKRLWGDMCKI
jgi:predicted transcriptional regulator of viral defense system